MTREETVALVGVDLVEKVEALDCECTCRVTDGTEWEGWTEYAASVRLENGTALVAYYYQRNEDVLVTEDGAPDLGDLTWEIDHYEVG